MKNLIALTSRPPCFTDGTNLFFWSVLAVTSLLATIALMFCLRWLNKLEEEDQNMPENQRDESSAEAFL